MEVTSEVVGAATVPLELLGAPGWAPGIWLPGTVAAWLPGLVVRAIGTAFITATSCIAMAGFSSLAGLGGVVTATTIVVVGNGSRPDGVRNGSGSAAATIRYDFCQKLLMPAERDRRASARSFRPCLTRSSRLSRFGRQEGVLLSCL